MQDNEFDINSTQSQNSERQIVEPSMMPIGYEDMHTTLKRGANNLPSTTSVPLLSAILFLIFTIISAIFSAVYIYHLFVNIKLYSIIEIFAMLLSTLGITALLATITYKYFRAYFRQKKQG